MGAEGTLPPKQHKRKRSLAEQVPGSEPGMKRSRAGKDHAATTENAAVPASMHPPPGTAAKRVSRQLDHGPNDAVASSSASNVPSGEVYSTPATGPTAHVCRHCEKRFRSPGKLAQHERVHTRDEVPFYCSFCPKRFRYQSQATEHERRHTSEKPYACSMCPVRFAHKSTVAPHERTHTGEKPYACSMCPVRFANKSAVAPHERTHTGEKPYEIGRASCRERV